jgi:hypothetical protein
MVAFVQQKQRSFSADCPVLPLDRSRGTAPGKEVRFMLTVDGIQFEQCEYCHNWYPLEEMLWDNKRLIWMCGYPNCTPDW